MIVLKLLFFENAANCCCSYFCNFYLGHWRHRGRRGGLISKRTNLILCSNTNNKNVLKKILKKTRLTTRLEILYILKP